MICPAGERGAATVFATSRSVWSFPSGEKSGCVCRPVSSGRNGRAYAGCSVLHLAGRYVGSVLLFSALLAAAKRGVRVRLLLDDNNTPGLDDILRLLDSHPRIEVRLFNPFSFRLLRPLGYITDFSRLNRRMHNKSFTVDGVVTSGEEAESLVMPILEQGRSHFFGFRCHGNRTRGRGRCR